MADSNRRQGEGHVGENQEYNTNDTATCVTYITNYICHTKKLNKQNKHTKTENKNKNKRGDVHLTQRYFPCWFTLALKTLNIKDGKKGWDCLVGRKVQKERETPNW